jgi:WhiB family redox-sensing transcriptional regulator
VTDTYWDWRPKGLCNKLPYQTSDRLFFPKSGRSINQAKKFCGGCPVADQCLEFALENRLPGIYAGTNEKERRGILRLRDKISGVSPPRKITRKNIIFT